MRISIQRKSAIAFAAKCSPRSSLTQRISVQWPEYRGEFTDTATDIPGYRVCDMMPKLAKMCQKLAILRSVYHTHNEHSQGTHTVLTGYAPTKGDPAQEFPSCGSIIAKELGPRCVV